VVTLIGMPGNRIVAFAVMRETRSSSVVRVSVDGISTLVSTLGAGRRVGEGGGMYLGM